MSLTFEEKMNLLIYKINKNNPIKKFNIKIEDFECLPYARPRTGKFGNVYNPRSKYKNELKKLIKKKLNNKDFPCKGPVKLTIIIGIKYPKNIENSKIKRYLAKELLFLQPQVRPDVDNYSKPVLDVLNKIMYEDDGQIVDLRTVEYYTDVPYLEINAEYRKDKIKLR